MREFTETSDRRLAQRISEEVKGEISEDEWFEKLAGEDKTMISLVELRGFEPLTYALRTHRSPC